MILATALLAATYTTGSIDADVRLYQTTAAREFREIPTSEFTVHPYPATPALDFDSAKELHEFVGLGAALTDSSAWILANMDPDRRAKLLRDLFTPEGCNLSVLRLNMGASDYSTALYTYDDTPGDLGLKNFSLAHDDLWLVPMAKEIQRLRPDVRWYSAPWSPPGWMKTSGLMIGGELKEECRGALAQYFVKYLQGYAERGIRISAVTPQNEPLIDTDGTYPSCLYTAEQETRFVVDHLAPALKAAKLDTKIWIFDHNCEAEAIGRVKGQLADEKMRAVVDGIAWHCYCPSSEAVNLRLVADLHPELPFYHTENGPHLLIERTEWWWAEKVFGMLQNGCRIFTAWNLCLDENGMPLTGPHQCAGFTVVDSATQEVTHSPQYNLFRHLGSFVRRGARVLGIEGSRDGTRLIAFRNPNGECVLVVACDGSPVKDIQRHRLVIKHKGAYKTLPLPAGKWSISTLVFK